MPMLLEERPESQVNHLQIENESSVLPELDHEQTSKPIVDFQKDYAVSLVEYCRQVPIAKIDTTCGEAAAMLNDGKEHPCIVLCDDQMKPTGLLMRDTLYRLLNGRFAADLFYRKPIVKTVDASPVIVDIHMDPAAIIDAALGRDEDHFYDCLLVTEEERLCGVLTIRDVMSLSQKLQQAASADRIRTVRESGQEISRIHSAVTKLVQAANQTTQEAGQVDPVIQ